MKWLLRILQQPLSFLASFFATYKPNDCFNKSKGVKRKDDNIENENQLFHPFMSFKLFRQQHKGSRPVYMVGLDPTLHVLGSLIKSAYMGGWYNQSVLWE